MSLLAYGKGRLFRWMALAITAGIVLAAATAILLGSSSLGSLGARLGTELDQAQGEVSGTLAASLDEASKSVDESASDIKKEVSGQLRSDMSAKLGEVKKVLEGSLSESADNLADLLAKVSVEPILAKQFATLVTYAKEANRNPEVLYAVFARPDGSLLTRYLDRGNPRVKSLLEQGEGRVPIDRLLSAAATDSDVRTIRKEIRFEDRSIGEVRLGIDLSDIRAHLDAIDRSFEQLVEASSTHATEVVQTHFKDLRTGLGGSFEQVRKQQDALARETGDVLREASTSLAWRLGLTMSGVGALILVALLGFFVLRVFRPLHALSAAMEDVAAGDGDLTRRLPDRGGDEITLVAHAFNDFVGKIQGTLLQARQTTNALTEAASRLADVAGGNSQHMQTHQGETAQVATAVTEMAATVREIAENAESAAFSAVQADQHTAQGRDLMQTTVAAIARLADEVEGASRVINRLKEDGDAIGSVLDVIRAIAGQTNLLALNAAIEAARAGEQGRGFAVVADEVRTLASRTQQSTAEIQGMIQALQGGTEDAVKVMQEGMEQARQTVEMADTAGVSLTRIAEAVASINQMNTQIATAAEEHTAVAETIDRSVIRISDLAEQAASGANDVARDSQALARSAEKLGELVRQFKL